MAQFLPFDFPDEVIDRFRAKREIPVNFYNKDGQVLIYQKDQATSEEIEGLMRFVDQGIFYSTDDTDKLGLGKRGRDVPDGLTDTKLLSEQAAGTMTANTVEFFEKLKSDSLGSFETDKVGKTLDGVFTDFQDQPDAMVGLVNILSLMSGMDAPSDVEMAVKRTTVAMALKTRGMHAMNYREKKKVRELVNIIMTSALLCDVGCNRMTMPTGDGLSEKEMQSIQNHPFLSYLALAPMDDIDTRIKRNVLCHHRPLRDNRKSNNYPTLKWLIRSLDMLAEVHQDLPGSPILGDIKRTRLLLIQELPYDEDANILSIASAFASLTSRTAWRDAFPALRAVKMIVNQSFFGYSYRALREFLDYVAISLCDNQLIIKEQDILVLGTRSAEGKPYFEVVRVLKATRHQSCPLVMRLGVIAPTIEQTPRIAFTNFSPRTFREDKRRARFDLGRDGSRQIVYVVDAFYDAELYEAMSKVG